MDSKKIRMIATIAMLSAAAYVAMYFSKSLPPIVPIPPLRYDPKDIFILIGGFLYGPLVVLPMSVLVSLIEMVTVSVSGPFGLLMNVVSTCAFVLPATMIYRKIRSIKGAVIGLAVGVLTVSAVMMLWNYIIMPIYWVMLASNEELAANPELLAENRARVANILVPVLLPFNMLKASLNATLTMLIYKPLLTALRKMRMLLQDDEKGRMNMIVILVSLFAVITTVLLTLVFMGVI
jgi:riboflavin transporter FmnP